MSEPNGRASGTRGRRTREDEDLPPVGQMPIVAAALVIGILLMSIQLWLLTVALDLYLGDNGAGIWRIAVISVLIFLGGLGMLRLLRRRPRVRGTTAG
jgi:hypothetical protein